MFFSKWTNDTKLSANFSLRELTKSSTAQRKGIDNFVEVFNFIREELEFDQVILEYYDGVDPRSGWVHVSYVSPKQNRKRAMPFNGKNYRIV